MRIGYFIIFILMMGCASVARTEYAWGLQPAMDIDFWDPRMPDAFITLASPDLSRTGGGITQVFENRQGKHDDEFSIQADLWFPVRQGSDREAEGVAGSNCDERSGRSFRQLAPVKAC
jgi:hypothetical protein